MAREEEAAASTGERPRPRFDPLPEWAGPSTRLIHSARRPEWNAGAVVPPIFQTSTYHFPSAYSEAVGKGDLYLYTRHSNPTQEVAAELVRALEGGESARVFGSGMGAISTTLLTLLKPGETIVALENLYGGTLALLRDLLPRYGVPVRFVSDSEARDPDAALAEGARVVYLESPTNPRLGVHDLARWARAADEAGALMVVDNTFATPINQRPLDLGADLVIHSGTKYLGGHADLLAGVVVGARGLVDRLDATHSVLGSVLDPLAAFLLARGLRTLELRMDRHNRNGAQVAEALAQHPKVRAVHYPGRGSAEEEKVVARQMRGRGGMVAVEVEGGVAGAHRFLRRLRFIHPASSLGGVESLASIPAETSHRHLTPEQLADRGIAPGLVRLSLGIENGDDLVRDLSESLDAL